MRYLIDCGHCIAKGSADTGCSGNGKREEICTREIGYKVQVKLKALGHTATIVSCDSATSVLSSLAYRVNKANNLGGDLYVAIHLNCGGGHGVEIFTMGAKSFHEATRTLNNIVAMGFTNRKIKDGKGLYVIHKTDMKSMLVECGFMDSASDMQKYNAEKFANAIVTGITGQAIKSPVIVKPVVIPVVPIKFRKTIKIIIGTPLINEKGANIRNFAVNDLVTAVNEDASWWILPMGKISKVHSQEVKPVEKGKIYRVVSGSYSEEVNADNKIKLLAEKGIESFKEVIQ